MNTKDASNTSRSKRSTKTVTCFFILIGLSVCLNFGCDRKHQVQTAAKGDKPIIVKGLRIGMTFDELSDAVEKLGKPWEIYTSDKKPKELEILSGINPLMTKGDYS